MNQLLDSLGQAFAGILGAPIVQLGGRLAVGYLVLLWLAAAWWAHRDAARRTTNPVAPYAAGALIVLATPVLFVFAVLLYRVVRPGETLAESFERRLSQEALAVEVEGVRCRRCHRPANQEWLVCPTCGDRLRRQCAACSRLVELDWTLCAWCGREFEPGMAALADPRPDLVVLPEPPVAHEPPIAAALAKSR